MILVDTCGWIEWLTEGALVNSFASYMKDPAELAVGKAPKAPDCGER